MNGKRQKIEGSNDVGKILCFSNCERLMNCRKLVVRFCRDNVSICYNPYGAILRSGHFTMGFLVHSFFLSFVSGIRPFLMMISTILIGCKDIFSSSISCFIVVF